jgi:hypothetical protein
MDDLKKIKNFIEYYYQKYKISFRVQHFRKEPRPWINYKGKDNKDEKWLYYTSGYGNPNHREPLPCEIIMDIDYHVPKVHKKTEEKAFKITLKAIENKLNDLHLSYSLWNSGGNGYHFHLFFDELLKYSDFERKELKQLIIRHLAYGFLTFHKDRAKVDSPVMITVENMFSRKNKKKTLIKQIDEGDNKIPKEIMIKYDISKDLKRHIKKPIPLTNGEPNSIKFLLSSDIGTKDGKKRALFVLSSWFAQKYGNDFDIIYQHLHEWNSYTLRGYHSTTQMRSTVRSVLKSRSRVTSRYRDRLMEEIGVPEFRD